MNLIKRRTIAVVDDDGRLLESLENLFESAGYDVRTFNSARAMIDAGLAGLDCIITDIGMPHMNGFALREKVKEARPDLPVFMLTGRHDASDRQRAEANGIAGFFHKPFDGQELLRAVARAVGG